MSKRKRFKGGKRPLTQTLEVSVHSQMASFKEKCWGEGYGRGILLTSWLPGSKENYQEGSSVKTSSKGMLLESPFLQEVPISTVLPPYSNLLWVCFTNIIGISPSNQVVGLDNHTWTDYFSPLPDFQFGLLEGNVELTY